MLKLALRNIMSRKLRFAMTAIAIILGTAMMSGTYVLTDQITGAFDDIFAKANQGVDVIVTRKQAFDSQQGAQTAAFDDALLEKVKGVDGVDVAEGLMDGTGSLVVDDESVTSVGGAPALLISTPINQRFLASNIATGRFPTAPGEVAVDVGLAEREKLSTGAKLQVATTTGLHPATLVGTFRFADSGSLGGTILIAVTVKDAQEWTGNPGKITSIVAAGTAGTAPATLKQNIQAALGETPNLRIETGSESADRQAKSINDNLGFLSTTLTVFALIAILVGAFVIFNVFSITIAQRIREIAMLRTIGASRGQIRGSVVLEALIIGFVASLIGIGCGVLIALGLKAIFSAAGFGLPTAALRVAPRTVLIPLIIGTVVTVLSVIIPATRATKIPPVAALREGAVLPKSRFSRYTPYIGLGVAVLGIVLIALGFSSDAALSRRLLLIAVGGGAIVLGIGLAIRLLIRPLARLLGAPGEAIFGNSASLARQNAVRDPARTASTATALMIGVGLVVFIAVFAHGFKVSFFDAIDRNLRVDQIAISENFTPMPAGATQVARAVPGVRAALGVGSLETKIQGTNALMNAIDPAAARSLVRFDWQNGGTDALLDQLGTDGAILEESLATDESLKVGDTFSVTAIDGQTGSLTVRGIYRDPQLFTGYTVSDAAYRRFTETPVVGVLLTQLAPGADLGNVTASLQDAMKQAYPTVKVRTKAEYKDFVNTSFASFLNIFYALLALSVLISLVGVVITLFLAIYERTREIGMMRAVGTTRGQIRAMILHEGVITCLIGGVVGVFVGLLLGWVIIKGLEGEGLGFSVPYGTLVVVLILTVIAGLLAAFLPSRRAAKLRPLEALHYE